MATEKQIPKARDLEREQAVSTPSDSLDSQPTVLHASPTLCPSDSTLTIEKGLQADSTEVPSELLVTWNGDDDSENPLNWSTTRRWSITFLVSFGTFINMMSASMIAPALTQISHDIKISEASAELVLSSYLLALTFGPLILAPFSEIYGRRPVWLVCGTCYALWNVFCGFCHNTGMLVAGRILAGLGGSVGSVMSYPVLGDIFRPEQRGLSIMIGGLVPVLGPALGPLIGGIIAGTIGWRWIFWWAAIFYGVLIAIAFFVFPETSAARILGRKAYKLRKETGLGYHTIYEGPDVRLSEKLKVNLSRPTKLLFTSPILVLAAVYWAYSFGLFYFFVATFAQLFTDVYGQTVLQSGLHYLSIAVGNILADQLGGLLMDKLWASLTKKKGGPPTPEYRVPLMLPGAIMIPIGLLWAGWSAHARLHWIMPDIGAALVGCGLMLIANATAAYILDSFEKYTASAMAAGQVLRMTAGFVFPIFAPAMYKKLGWGWANTTLALIAFVFQLPVPWILWKYGARIRAWKKPDW